METENQNYPMKAANARVGWAQLSFTFFKFDSEKILRTKSYLVEEEWNSKSLEDH
jgi:hypothetical protein